MSGRAVDVAGGYQEEEEALVEVAVEATRSVVAMACHSAAAHCRTAVVDAPLRRLLVAAVRRQAQQLYTEKNIHTLEPRNLGSASIHRAYVYLYFGHNPQN